MQSITRVLQYTLRPSQPPSKKIKNKKIQSHEINHVILPSKFYMNILFKKMVFNHENIQIYYKN